MDIEREKTLQIKSFAFRQEVENVRKVVKKDPRKKWEMCVALMDLEKAYK